MAFDTITATTIRMIPIGFSFAAIISTTRARAFRSSSFFDGVHEDYHRLGDEPQKIDYQKMEKVARTIYMTLLEVANRPLRPKVDKQLPAQLQQRAG